MAGKSLTDAQNERIRDWMRELMNLSFDSNQTRLAEAMKISQETISAFLGH